MDIAVVTLSEREDRREVIPPTCLACVAVLRQSYEIFQLPPEDVFRTFIVGIWSPPRVRH